jgi:hypothetical protein
MVVHHRSVEAACELDFYSFKVGFLLAFGLGGTLLGGFCIR